MKNIFLLTSLIALIIIGCKDFHLSKNSTSSNSDELIRKNPVISCIVPEITKDIIQVVGGSELSGKEGVADFCNRMHERFASSEMTIKDSEKIFEILNASGFALDEPFGQPGSSRYRQTENKPSLSEKISIRKIDDYLFEVFFIKTGCGKTYFHGKFTVPQKASELNIIPIEVWKASYPC